MLVQHDFAMGFLIVIMAILGMILISSLGATLRLDRWHPALVGAVLGALVGVMVIEAVPLLV